MAHLCHYILETKNKERLKKKKGEQFTVKDFP